jgi:hypothetical protein
MLSIPCLLLLAVVAPATHIHRVTTLRVLRLPRYLRTTTAATTSPTTTPTTVVPWHARVVRQVEIVHLAPVTTTSVNGSSTTTATNDVSLVAALATTRRLYDSGTLDTSFRSSSSPCQPIIDGT